MVNYREWLDRDTKSSHRMPQLLPILIRQARLETPITYGDAARELGVHHRATHHIAGHIGHTLNSIANTPGWKRRPPPPLQSLVVNDMTRLPGSGIKVFMSKEYLAAKTPEKKRAVLKAVYADLAAYKHWDEVCDLLAIPLESSSLEGAVEKAKRSAARGEGPEHKALKFYVANHPEIVGLPQGSGGGSSEYPIASGDRIDVVFERRALRFAVEVKPASASEGDQLRGVFQCLKYRVILQTESALSDNPFRVKVMLVLGGDVPHRVMELANRLGIKVKGGVVPSR
jgi:hypothetical protein